MRERLRKEFAKELELEETASWGEIWNAALWEGVLDTFRTRAMDVLGHVPSF